MVRRQCFQFFAVFEPGQPPHESGIVDPRAERVWSFEFAEGAFNGDFPFRDAADENFVLERQYRVARELR